MQTRYWVAPALCPHDSVTDFLNPPVPLAGPILPNAPGAFSDTVVGGGAVVVVVGFGVVTSALSTADVALTMPVPQLVAQVLPSGNAVAVPCSTVATSLGARPGLAARTSDATPATCGAAMLVPW